MTLEYNVYLGIKTEFVILVSNYYIINSFPLKTGMTIQEKVSVNGFDIYVLFLFKYIFLFCHLFGERDNRYGYSERILYPRYSGYSGSVSNQCVLY